MGRLAATTTAKVACLVVVTLVVPLLPAFLGIALIAGCIGRYLRLRHV